MPVRDRTHDVAGGQVVEVVIHTQDGGQDEGGPQGAFLALQVLHGPVAVGLGAAGPDHQGYHGAQNHQEDQDAGVAADVVAQVGDQGGNGGHGVELHLDEVANQNAEEQGGVDLLGDQRQTDGHDGGNQGPDGAVEPALAVLSRQGEGGHEGDQRVHDQQNFAESVLQVFQGLHCETSFSLLDLRFSQPGPTRMDTPGMGVASEQIPKSIVEWKILGCTPNQPSCPGYLPSFTNGYRLRPGVVGLPAFRVCLRQDGRITCSGGGPAPSK